MHTEITSSRCSTWDPQAMALLVSLASTASWLVISEVCWASALSFVASFLLSKMIFPEKTTYPNKSDFSSPTHQPPSPASRHHHMKLDVPRFDGHDALG